MVFLYSRMTSFFACPSSMPGVSKMVTGTPGYVVALHVLGDRLPYSFVGEADSEHGVDEGALADPGLSADEDVRVAELGHFALSALR